MNDSPSSPVRGLVAGKYEVLRLIGRGGMGSVWEGRHVSLGTRVAIKFIDQEHAANQEARSRFVTEARAAAAIESKHAIQIFDQGVTDEGRAYIVMELLVGEPLDKRLERVGALPLQDTARVLQHVCRALQRAHDAGVVHRDLKPENVFLVRSPDDDDEIAKVLDFGIAKIKGPPGGASLTSSTKTGAVLGTPYYMSPEQARGLRTVDHRTDIWSLGVIAYKCVTGVLPFDGESVGDLLVKICTAPLPVPSATVPGLPAAFDAWFFRALDRDPARRFQRAAELADALGLVAGVSARRAPNSAVPATGPHPGAVLPAAGVTSAPFTASPLKPRASRTSKGALLAAIAAAVVGGSIGVATVVKMASTPSAGVARGEAMATLPAGSVSVASPVASAQPVAPPTPAAVATATSPAPTATLGPTATATPPLRPSARPPLPKPVVTGAKPSFRPTTQSADPGY